MPPTTIRDALHDGIRAVAERCSRLETNAHKLVDARPFTVVGTAAGIVRMVLELLRNGGPPFDPASEPRAGDDN